MASGTSRGKQSFRDFSKTLTSLKRFTIKAIKDGNVYSYEQVESWFNEILDIYASELESEGLDYELWYTRAKIKAEEVIQLLDNEYSFERADDAGSTEDTEGDEEEQDSEDSIMGYPIITTDECIDETDGSPRGTILLSIEELEEYIAAIPPDAIRGIILHRLATPYGYEQGFSVCVGATL